MSTTSKPRSSETSQTRTEKTQITSNPQAMQEAMKPGPEHAKLMKTVGTWKVAVTCWMDGKETISTGTSEISAIFDDRYTREEFTGEFDGKEFQGVGTMGYDNAAKLVVSTWYDSMGTGIVYSSGPAAAKGKDLELRGEMTCPIKGPMTLRQVHKQESENRCIVTMYNIIDGKETKSMELAYTREK